MTFELKIKFIIFRILKQDFLRSVFAQRLPVLLFHFLLLLLLEFCPLNLKRLKKLISLRQLNQDFVFKESLKTDFKILALTLVYVENLLKVNCGVFLRPCLKQQPLLASLQLILSKHDIYYLIFQLSNPHTFVY